MAWRTIIIKPEGCELTENSNCESNMLSYNFSNNIEGCLVLSLAFQNL